MAASQWLALEWDRHELRVLVVSGSARDLRLGGAYAFALPELETPADAEKLGWLVREALATLTGVGKSVAMVAAPGSVLLRHMKLPPAPDAELPGLVRFQAAGELTSTLEGASIDFSVLPHNRGPEPVPVLMAAVPDHWMQQYRKTLQTAGLTARHLALRGEASGTALSAQLGGKSGNENRAVMLVDYTAEMLCLTVLVGRDCVLTRSRRLPHANGDRHGETAMDRDRAAAFLTGEIARTLTAFHAQFPARNVQDIFLAGAGESATALAEAVGRSLERQIQLFDPLAWIEGAAAAPQMRGIGGADPLAQEGVAGFTARGRFAALAGLARCEAAAQTLPMDFFHPKEPVKDRGSKKRLAVVLGTAAAAVIGMAGLWYAITHGTLASQLAAVEEESKKLDEYLAQYEQVDRDSRAIGQWQEKEVIWLDELYVISSRFPNAQDAYVTKLDFLPHQGPLPNRVRIDAVARSESVAAAFHRDLSRDRDHYRVHPEGVQEQATPGQYSWQFKSQILVTPLLPEQYAQLTKMAKAEPAEKEDNDNEESSAEPSEAAAASGTGGS